MGSRGLLELRAFVAVARARRLLAREGTVAALRSLTADRDAPVTGHDDALRSVRRAGRVLRAPCLPQAVALTALLHGSAQTPTMVLGCRRYGAGQWGAHAWVEVAGAVLDPLPSGAHQVLARCDAAHGWVPRAVEADR